MRGCLTVFSPKFGGEDKLTVLVEPDWRKSSEKILPKQSMGDSKLLFN